MLARLRHVSAGDSSNDIVVCSTHLASDPAHFLRRADQARALVKGARTLAESPTRAQDVVICGDFNGREDEEFFDVMRKSSLHSLYAQLHQGPRYTFGMALRHYTIDFIFSGERTASRVNSVLSLPVELKLLPTSWCPSDHLPLGVEIAIGH